MTFEEIRAALARAAATDPQLRALEKRIRAGKASFTDTSIYSQRLSALLGRVFSAEVEALSPEVREAVCKALLRAHYEDINDILAEVQETLDAAQSLALTPQRAPYPAERVQQLAHSLQDAAATLETLRRRADTGAANVAHSMHDDYIETNARLRSDLGLKCHLTRTVGSTSCKWCAGLAGRYVYGRHPDDIFRRHDNCTCTVTYENGRERQDVWSKRSWMASPGEVMRDAVEPTVNSREEAEQLEGAAISGLTLAGERDIINLQDIVIGRSLGSGARNYDIMDLSTGEIFHLVEGSRLQDVQVFAGKGTRTEFRNAEKYAARYGGKPADWQHVKGHGLVDFYGDERSAELHWVQCEGIGKHEFFVKRWLD